MIPATTYSGTSRVEQKRRSRPRKKDEKDNLNIKFLKQTLEWKAFFVKANEPVWNEWEKREEARPKRVGS